MRRRSWSPVSPFLAAKLPKFFRHFHACRRMRDLGAGQGEFLQAFKQTGIAGEGVELDSLRVRADRAAGFTVHKAEAFAFLRKAARGRYGGLFMSNLIEPLMLDQAQSLLQTAKRRLAPGAKLALTTADPRRLPMLLGFWEAPQLTRPYPAPVLRERLEEAGFKVQRLEPDEDTRPQGPTRALLRGLRSLLVGPYFGPPEIYVLAEKA